jgi:hypothetical protein
MKKINQIIRNNKNLLKIPTRISHNNLKHLIYTRNMVVVAVKKIIFKKINNYNNSNNLDNNS